MTRRDVLIEMLRRYEDAQETLLRSGSGPGEAAFLMPPTWTRAYRELYRCLCALRESDRESYRHLHARYLDPWRMRVVVKVSRDGRPLLPPRCELACRELFLTGKRETSVVVNAWAEWVDVGRVARGLDFLEREFRGEPFLPAELVDVA